MSKRIQKAVMAVAAIGALAAGGSAIASAQNPGPTPTSTPPAVTQSATSPEKVGGPDTDNIQSGDQTTPDTATASPVSAKASSATTEAPGTEQSAASEQPGAAEQPGSESAANSDGPGGHADEPGNPSADHQFQGTE
jgi:hypothetical protein